ncbi:MAG TPA: imidazole glycerol phosphate synthase subunit HisH [Rhodospirillaceae bacterium]|nr:imidazole glycerol phosphate synthase subunit HisH [Rhodospirillaceae bacterium]HAT35732.1 imidazole glycerol phosphate synthase subunit HisH [Rhodospirillaceae bacterium]|tara:strand:- start:230 stop:886 length:657 start_codon:yes stop_codon:yes gene_type:complete
MLTIAIIDCGIGNLRSVQRAFESADVSAPITDDPGTLDKADSLVLPGVGAFKDAMHKLTSTGLDAAIKTHVQERNKPILGICLGMQLLAHSSREDGDHTGLGILPASVEPLDVSGQIDWAGRKLTLPHIGWNEIDFSKNSILFDGIPDRSDFYFVHSFHVACDQEEHVAATTEYGSPFASVLEHGNIFATQFHPEKSQRLGQQLIQNFIKCCGQRVAA